MMTPAADMHPEAIGLNGQDTGRTRGHADTRTRGHEDTRTRGHGALGVPCF